jgi:hypothetical protein
MRGAVNFRGSEMMEYVSVTVPGSKVVQGARDGEFVQAPFMTSLGGRRR